MENRSDGMQWEVKERWDGEDEDDSMMQSRWKKGKGWKKKKFSS